LDTNSSSLIFPMPMFDTSMTSSRPSSSASKFNVFQPLAGLLNPFLLTAEQPANLWGKALIRPWFPTKICRSWFLWELPGDIPDLCSHWKVEPFGGVSMSTWWFASVMWPDDLASSTLAHTHKRLWLTQSTRVGLSLWGQKMTLEGFEFDFCSRCWQSRTTQGATVSPLTSERGYDQMKNTSDLRHTKSNKLVQELTFCSWRACSCCSGTRSLSDPTAIARIFSTFFFYQLPHENKISRSEQTRSNSTKPGKHACLSDFSCADGSSIITRMKTFWSGFLATSSANGRSSSSDKQ
jgi:hypothetical protein